MVALKNIWQRQPQVAPTVYFEQPLIQVPKPFKLMMTDLHLHVLSSLGSCYHVAIIFRVEHFEFACDEMDCGLPLHAVMSVIRFVNYRIKKGFKLTV